MSALILVVVIKPMSVVFASTSVVIVLTFVMIDSESATVVCEAKTGSVFIVPVEAVNDVGVVPSNVGNIIGKFPTALESLVPKSRVP